jgi:hypothetical protein
MLLIASQYFDMLTNFAINQALANPRKSQELAEFVQEIVHNEISSLMREHNNITKTQHDQITSLNTAIEKLQRERMERINSHAAEIHGLHVTHAAEIQCLHRMYTEKLNE